MPVIFAVWFGVALWHEWPTMSGWQHDYYLAAMPAFALFYAALWLTRKEEK